MTRWAGGGAIIAGIFSILSLLLPPALGGYNAWNDVHMVVHNLAAILTRVVVFALIGAALTGAWHHKKHVVKRRGPNSKQRGARHAVQGPSRRR